MIKTFFKLYVSGSPSPTDVNPVHHMSMFRGIVHGPECDANTVRGDTEERVIKLHRIRTHANVKHQQDEAGLYI